MSGSRRCLDMNCLQMVHDATMENESPCSLEAEHWKAYQNLEVDKNKSRDRSVQITQSAEAILVYCSFMGF